MDATANLNNETYAVLIFTDEYNNNKSLNCNFTYYNKEKDDLGIIECPINQTIKSNFSNSKLKLPQQNIIVDLDIVNRFITYNYNVVKFLRFGGFKTNNDNKNISYLNAYFEKPSNYTIKNNLFFGVKLGYNNSEYEWVIAEGIESEKNINGTLIYNVTIVHQNLDILNITSSDDYCLTDQTDNITYCDGAKGDKTDMKVEYEIITFYNSKILNPNDRTIRIKGDLSDTLNLIDNSNNLNLSDSSGNIINCSLSTEDYEYNMNCTLGEKTETNLLYATANITNIINTTNLRILEEGTGTLAWINGDKDNLGIDYIPKITPTKTSKNSDGLSAGTVVGIVFACVAAVIAGIIAAICLSKKPPASKNISISSKSTDNINQN